jgi:predicted transcriptional regulator
MASIDEQILRAAKEIVVKFIETGRLSPTGFHELFRDVYHTLEETVKGVPEDAVSGTEAPADPAESDA